MGDGELWCRPGGCSVFFNRHIPQAVLGTKTNNKRVMKRSKSYTVLMGNWLWGQMRKIRGEIWLGCGDFWGRYCVYIFLNISLNLHIFASCLNYWPMNNTLHLVSYLFIDKISAPSKDVVDCFRLLPLFFQPTGRCLLDDAHMWISEVVIATNKNLTSWPNSGFKSQSQ